MKPHPLKKQIKTHIKILFDMLNPGDRLRTEDIYKYCKRMCGKQFYPDTAIRYLRQMRQDEEINYNCVSKRERIIEVIEMGKGHSL